MSRTEYFLHIGVANKAGELHELANMVRTDGDLSAAEQHQIQSRIAARFSELNRIAVGLPVRRFGGYS